MTDKAELTEAMIEADCSPHCCCCGHYEPCCDCGEIMPGRACVGEKCWCGSPASKKVGEEILFDDPNPARHNLTTYVCARHYAQMMGPLGAKQVGFEASATPEIERDVDDGRGDEMRFLRGAVGRLGIGLRHLLACMDSCEEAGGSPAELDPQDRALVEETRREMECIADRLQSRGDCDFYTPMAHCMRSACGEPTLGPLSAPVSS